MKKNLKEPKQVPKNQQDGNNKYFKVFYSKDVNKKKKVFSQGVLAWENKKTKLYNSDGEVLVQVNQKNQPQVNEEYVIGYKYAVFIDSEFDKETFTSGRVFIALVDGNLLPLPSTSTTNAAKQSLKAQQKKLPKEKQAKKQTNLVDSNPVKINPNNKEATELENGLLIENMIYSKLREHQIQGVQFMYNCLMGYKSPSINGCILADFMGLGKTLQTITLIYSLLKMKKISKCIVISPLTLVYVWQKECKKWLDNKLCPLIALGDGEQVKNICKQFANNQYRMLVLSYEGFYRFIDVLDKKCDLIVFDEGHRLKNKNSKVYKKILNFSCRKRVLLTGTPLQNNLEELYTCISIVNPTMFSSEQLFNNVFHKPILNGMAKKATQIERKIAVQRTIELANKIKQFSLRRKADTLEKYLPIKREYFVLFKLTPLQKLWYEKLLKRKQTESDVLGFLNLFRKLFTHPQILKNDRLNKADTADFVEDSINQVSYKMNFVLDVCQKAVERDEKVIVVSYFTSTLDFIGKILKDNEISFVKLDGKVDGKDRQVVVNSFEREKNVLLLSGKAGGTGLTLITARTMIILEPDWNPSNDAQVIGRIWRQGQTQEVAIYRLVIISSFEQRIVERQQLKNALSQRLIDENKSVSSGYDFMDMKKLFVQSSEKSLFFKESENILDKIYSNSGLRWQGVVLVSCKMSHNHQNTEENLTQKQNKPKAIEMSQNNEFADGILLFEGLIQDQEENCDEKRDETSEDEETFNYEQKVEKQAKENKKGQRKQANSKLQEQGCDQIKPVYSLPVKINLKEQKVRKEVVLSKKVEPKNPALNSQTQENKKSRVKPKNLKKYQIVDMEDYKRFSSKGIKKEKINKEIEDNQETQFESSEQPQKLKIDRKSESFKFYQNQDLDKTLSNNKDDTSKVTVKNQSQNRKQQKKEEYIKKDLLLIEGSSEQTITNTIKLSNQTISSVLQSQQEDSNADKKSKKGNSLVLNKLKFKNKNQ